MRVLSEGDLPQYKHLRILDLSCNGLCRIPGLSSNCVRLVIRLHLAARTLSLDMPSSPSQSLKELKLYDNEIGEVEGMER